MSGIRSNVCMTVWRLCLVSALLIVFGCAQEPTTRLKDTAVNLWLASVQRSPAVRYIYLSNNAGTLILRYSVDPDSGTLTSLGATAGSGAQQPVTISRNGRLAYVPSAAGLLQAFHIDRDSGSLASAGTVTGAASGRILTLHPVLSSAYLNDAAGNVLYYTFSTDGIPAYGGLQAMGANAGSVAVHPLGGFAYSPSLTAGNIAIFPIDQSTGVLGSPSTAGSSTQPSSFSICPDGTCAYSVDSLGANQITMYTLNSQTGNLSSQGTITINGANTPPIVFSGTGAFAYIPNTSGSSVNAFRVGADGILSLVGSAAAQSAPGEVVLHPSGRFAFVSNFSSASVTSFSVDPATGGLTTIAHAAVGTNPRKPVIDPRGNFMHVVNFSDGTVTALSINSFTGELTPFQTIAALSTTNAPAQVLYQRYLISPGWVP